MKKSRIRFAVGVMMALVVFGASVVMAETPSSSVTGTDAERETFFETAARNASALWELAQATWVERLEIGARLKWYTIDDNRRPATGTDNFLGSINEQRKDESLMPMPFIGYVPNPYVSFGLTYDEVVSELWTQREVLDTGETLSAYTDGTLEIGGPAVYVTGYYPNDSMITPFVEAGLVFYSASFDHTNPEWRHAHGISDFQLMDPSADMGIRLGGGVDLNVAEAVEIVLYANQTWADVDLRHIIRGETHQTGTIPLDHIGYGIGVKLRL